jgi:hypothetical protein
MYDWLKMIRTKLQFLIRTRLVQGTIAGNILRWADPDDVANEVSGAVLFEGFMIV